MNGFLARFGEPRSTCLGGKPNWRIRTKRRRLSARYRAGVLGAVVALVAVPYAEELVRCLQTSRERLPDGVKLAT